MVVKIVEEGLPRSLRAKNPPRDWSIMVQCTGGKGGGVAVMVVQSMMQMRTPRKPKQMLKTSGIDRG